MLYRHSGHRRPSAPATRAAHVVVALVGLVAVLVTISGCDVARYRVPPPDASLVSQLVQDFGSTDDPTSSTGDITSAADDPASETGDPTSETGDQGDSKPATGDPVPTLNVAQVPRFRMNAVFAHKLENHGADLSDAVTQTQAVLSALFGTPDQPLLPRCITSDPGLGSLMSLENLQRAAGPVYSVESGTNFGLYRKHCVMCHGVSGDGNGPTASLLNPYPRDFRMGVFKFKSTSNGYKPTRDDMRQSLVRGHAGSSMPSFRLLRDEDIEALVDYVIYLTLRGEVERALYREAAQIGYGTETIPPDEQLIAGDLKTANPEAYTLQLDFIEKTTQAAAEPWLQAAQGVVAIPALPENTPHWPLPPDASDEHIQQMKASIARGQALFGGRVANCSICHGEGGNGDGVVNDYDDWTKEWSLRNGLDPADPEKKPLIKEFVRLGAHRPRNIQPRNMTSGAFRGGRRPEDLYRRIVQGIDGTPMPAVSLIGGGGSVGLTQGDVWDIVHYILSLSQPMIAAPTSAEQSDAGDASNKSDDPNKSDASNESDTTNKSDASKTSDATGGGAPSVNSRETGDDQ